MSRKNNKGKPTRNELNQAVQNLANGYKLIVEKINFMENFIKSTDLALDLYVKFKGDAEKFKERIQEFNKEQEEAQKKAKETVVKEEKVS